MESIFFFFFWVGVISIKFVISHFLLDLLFLSRLWYWNLERVKHNIHWVFLSRVVLNYIRITLPYLVQMPFMGEPGPLDYVYPIFNLFVHCTRLPVGLVALKHAENFFANFESFSSHFVCPGFNWFGKSLSNTDLIFFANITTAGVMAYGSFLSEVTQ